ncbi:sensor histidine kinase [Cohnella fermenti]|uniref:sensor histidine kinase n=1 Tax=Cohnella fermenti TaxID=2565925 RepID=UPI001454DD61|nr:histidine kinase [Cohnella fermenti]
MIVLLIYISNYSITVVRDQVANSNHNLLQMYMKQVDQSLRSIDNYILESSSSDNDYFLLQSDNDNTYIPAEVRISNKLTDDFRLYNQTIDALFVYTEHRDSLIEAFALKEDYRVRTQIRQYLRSILTAADHTNGFTSEGWYAAEIGGRYYFFHIFKSGDVYFGAWASVDSLTTPFEAIDLGEKGRLLFTDEKGIPLTSEQGSAATVQASDNYSIKQIGHSDYLIVGSESSVGNFKLAALIPESNILDQLPSFRILVAIIALSILPLIPLSIYLLRRTVLKPLDRILFALKRTGDGNLGYRIPPFKSSIEFQILNTAYNKMMTQIQELKINVYEEKLSLQKAHFTHLQLQLNPHFLMNSLNVIHGLAFTKKNEIIQEMSICLVEYFRYILRSDSMIVPLKEEIKHVRNYLRIQQLRYRNRFTYEIDVPDELWETSVLPLMLQTFTENTLKHGISFEEQLSVLIRVERLEEDPAKLKIAIVDSGSGFDAEVLPKLNLGERITTSLEGGIGIWNLHQRLRFVYRDQFRLLFSNREAGGAVVEIVVPLQHEINLGEDGGKDGVPDINRG